MTAISAAERWKKEALVHLADSDASCMLAGEAFALLREARECISCALPVIEKAGHSSTDATAQIERIDALLNQKATAAEGESGLLEPRLANLVEFHYRHPVSEESHTVLMSRQEIEKALDDELLRRLSADLCICDQAGRASDADCECQEYGYGFELVRSESKDQIAELRADITRLDRLATQTAQLNEDQGMLIYRLEQALSDLIDVIEPDTQPQPHNPESTWVRILRGRRVLSASIAHRTRAEVPHA